MTALEKSLTVAKLLFQMNASVYEHLYLCVCMHSGVHDIAYMVETNSAQKLVFHF